MGKRSDGFERKARGFYPTPWLAFAPLAPFVPGRTVVEPCAGDGSLCQHLAAVGAHVAWALDIEPRHPDIIRADALTLARSWFDDLEPYLFVTNPPWPEPRRNGEPALSIARHLSVIAPTWLLLPADFMHNVYAAPAMRFCHKIVSVGRVRWIPDTDDDGKDNCAWYLFDQSAVAEALEFVPRQPKRRAAS